MKKKHFISILLAFIGYCILSGCSSQAKLSMENIKFRLHPETSKTYTIVSKTNTMTMLEVQGQSMSMTQNMDITQTFTPKEVSDNESVIETQVETIMMSVAQQGMKFEYDSEHPEKTSPMIADQTKEFEKNIKKPITLTYDAKGKLIGEKESFGMSQLDHVVIELPDQNITVGSKWSHTNEQEINGNAFTVNMDYTVTAVSKKNVDVSFTGKIESIEVTGTYNGTASIDPQTGLMMNKTMKTNISMTINQQGLNIPMTMVGTTTIEVK